MSSSKNHLSLVVLQSFQPIMAQPKPLLSTAFDATGLSAKHTDGVPYLFERGSYLCEAVTFASIVGWSGCR